MLVLHIWPIVFQDGESNRTLIGKRAYVLIKYRKKGKKNNQWSAGYFFIAKSWFRNMPLATSPNSNNFANSKLEGY